jgi:hypothetical protein
MSLPPNDLPGTAVSAYASLSPEQKTAFSDFYNSRKRSMPLMMALAILFPIQLFLLGRIVLGILFLITGGGLGVWYVVEWFLTPGRVRDYNAKVASETLTLIQSGAPIAPEVEEG